MSKATDLGYDDSLSGLAAVLDHAIDNSFNAFTEENGEEVVVGTAEILLKILGAIEGLTAEVRQMRERK